MERSKIHFPRNDATDVTGVVEKAESGEMDWKTCLETIFKMEQLQCAFEQETYGRIHLLLIKNEKNTLVVVRSVWSHHHGPGCQPCH